MSALSPLSAHHYRPMLEQGRWFSTIDEGLKQQVVANAIIRRLSANECIFSRGDGFNGLFAVVSGVIRISGVRGHVDSGKESLLALLEAPEWFGELTLFDLKQRSHSAWSESEAIVLQLPPQALATILEQHPNYWRDFALLLAQKLRFTFTVIEQTAVLQASGRLAYRLLIMSNWDGIRHSSLQRRVLTISQEQLSQLLALSRQTTNQILKEFERQKIIQLHRNSIEIVDLEGLKALVN